MELYVPSPKLFRLLVFFSLVLAAPVLWGNSAGNPQAENLQRVREFLNARSLEFEERPLLASFGGFSSSLHVRFPGPVAPAEGEETFVLAIPLDSGFAVETGLALVERLGASPHPPQTLVAFLGDEKVSLPPDIPSYGHKGLRDLLSLCEMPETWVLCYLDAGEAPGEVPGILPSEIVIRHGNGKYIAPLRVVKPLALLLSAGGIPSSFEIRYNEIYKLGLAEENRVLALAWEGEINGFCLSAAYGNEKAEKGIEAADLAEALFKYAEAAAFPLQNPDRHYSIISLFDETPLFIPEKVMVVFFVSLSAAFVFSFLVISVVKKSRLLKKLKIFFRYSWIILILLPLLMTIIKGAGFAYSRLLFLFKTTPPPGDYFGIGCTVLLALVLFSLTPPLIKFFPIPEKAGFFGFSAVIVAILGGFMAMVMDFTFLPVFIWASFFTLPGALLKNPVPVFLFALLVPFQILMAFFNIRETAGEKLAELLLSGWGGPGWVTALQIAAPALPFVLLLEKAMALISSRMKKQENRRGHSFLKNSPLRRLALLGLVLSLMVIRILAATPPPPPPERRFFGDSGGDIFSISTKNTFFEESRIIEVTLEAKGNPRRFNLYLEGENLSPVYSSPAPFRRGGGESIEFILGENPPNPFKAEIVLPRESEVFIRGEALYTEWDAALDKEGKPGTEDYVLRVSGGAELATSENQD
jgi:hypothetical protein